MSDFAGDDASTPTGPHVNTVLGPVPASDLGVTAVHESLLSVLPGAEYAPDITMDRAEIFEVLDRKLTAFRAAGGGTIVDSTGMFHGRDLRLCEALSRSTGVHIVASTGMGPEEMLGGYFLTPQTNPPTPWPAEKFAALFTQEVQEGMVIPRLERRAAAGLVATAADRTGITPTEESLFRGAARTALATGIPVSLRFGSDAVRELQPVLAEGLGADRVVIGGMDRKDGAGSAVEIARLGAYVGIDHVGLNDDGAYLDDAERADLVLELVEAGYAERVLLSSSAIGVAVGQPAHELPYTCVLTSFLPYLRERGLSEADARRITAGNPQALLSVR